MKKNMSNILKSVDIDVVSNKKEKVSKLFGNGKTIGIMLGDEKARFMPVHDNSQSSGFFQQKRN